jgi:xanthine dehydrogenase accessory factor
VTPSVLDTLRAARAANRPVALVTWLRSGEQRVIARTDAEAANDRNLDPQLAALVARVFLQDQAEQDGELFVEPFIPAPRLLLVGAVHIARPLAQMARLSGYDVTIVDPRSGFATAQRFPDEKLVVAWPDAALSQLVLDDRTAVVTLTHDPKLDDPALRVALASPAFYVGCLGSQKTHAARRQRLAAAGVSSEAIARLRGPVGLRIGARSPAEIAVSVLAEIIAARRGAA